jgi:hypothetical protein
MAMLLEVGEFACVGRGGRGRIVGWRVASSLRIEGLRRRCWIVGDWAADGVDGAGDYARVVVERC